MVYWGKAWAWGPYVNNGNPPEREPLEQAYYEAMKNVAGLYPESPEASDDPSARYISTRS